MLRWICTSLGGNEQKHAVLMRISSNMLPQRATYFSDGPIRNHRLWPTPRPRRTVLAILETRNRLHLKPYTIFLDADAPPKAYGVLALHADFADLFPHVCLLIDTVLLPFKNQITYDGQCRYYNIMFGGGITRRLNDSYQLAKAQSGIITTLPFVASEAAPSDEERPDSTFAPNGLASSTGKRSRRCGSKAAPWRRCTSRKWAKCMPAPIVNDCVTSACVGYGLPSSKASRLPVENAPEARQAVQRIVPQHKLPFVYTFEVKEPAKRRGNTVIRHSLRLGGSQSAVNISAASSRIGSSMLLRRLRRT